MDTVFFSVNLKGHAALCALSFLPWLNPAYPERLVMKRSSSRCKRLSSAPEEQLRLQLSAGLDTNYPELSAGAKTRCTWMYAASLRECPGPETLS